MSYLITTLVLVAKFSISFTYNCIYIITAEIYPTTIRNASVSICQAFARLGSIIAPSIQYIVIHFKFSNRFNRIIEKFSSKIYTESHNLKF